MKKQTGLTLLEIMIALSIATILTVFVIKSYIELYKFIKKQTESQAIFNKAKRISDVITDIAHQAGYIGCQRARSDTPITPSNRIYGSDTSMRIQAMNDLFGTIINTSSDVLMVHINDNEQLKSSDSVIISNCSHAYKRMITEKNGNTLILNKPITASPKMEIGRLNIYRIYLKKNALYLSINNKDHAKIATNVTQFKLLYLSSNRFTNSSAIINWATVSAIKASFKLDSKHFTVVANIKGARP